MAKANQKARRGGKPSNKQMKYLLKQMKKGEKNGT